MKEKIYFNGKIFTENEKMQWAQAVAIQGDEFICVGSNEECLKMAPGACVTDLKGKTVIPGLLDGHTHPVTVAKTIWHVRMPECSTKEELFATIKKYAEKNPKEKVPYFYGESYRSEIFGKEGPRREDLDRLIPDRPARIQDFTDHACWYNSKALEMLGADAGSAKVESPMNCAEFIKDEKGKATGWALEVGPDGDTGVYEAINWYPPKGTEEESVAPFLDYLKSFGIIGLFDGFTEGDEAMKMFYEMDMEGKLNMYYEAASLMNSYEDLENAISRVHRWRERYTTEHIHINTVKFFVDGTNEMGDSASLEPLRNVPSGDNYGAINITKEELAETLLRLNEEKIDMHMHVVCDRGFRTCCDAVEEAKKRCKEWNIYVTLAHCELIHPDDMKRAVQLGIFIDWSTHWAGGYFGEEAIEYLGLDRWKTMYDFTEIIKSGGIVGFSSDLFSYQEANRGDPYFGMQTSMTRVDIEFPLDPGRYPGSVRPPEKAKLTLEQLLKGYTINNALRMRMNDKAGSIVKGKKANMIVLDRDIFSVPDEQIKKIKAEKVLFEGIEQMIKSIDF